MTTRFTAWSSPSSSTRANAVFVNVVGNIRAEQLAKLGEKFDLKPLQAPEGRAARTQAVLSRTDAVAPPAGPHLDPRPP
jgi:hypothetical protein